MHDFRNNLRRKFQSKNSETSSAGFTIVELMIATMVFAVILLVITTGVLRFTADYYKGVNSSTNQNAARGAIEAISQAIQFGGPTAVPCESVVAGSLTGYVQFGNKEFFYKLNSQIPAKGSGPATYALYEVPTSPCLSSFPASPPANSRELLPPHTRLVAFNVGLVPGKTDLYNVAIKVAYGDDDLFCSPSQGNCTTSAPTTFNSDLICRPQTGSEFCDVTSLSTTVQRRVSTGG